MNLRAAFMPALALLVVACGNSDPVGGRIAQTPVTPVTPVTLSTDPRAQAARLLTQATFGPRMADIQQLAGQDYGAWIDRQMAITPTYELPDLQSQTPINSDARNEIWWRVAVTAPDQLRQRMAYALSQIMVVSETASSSLGAAPESVAYYNDVLVRDAFGSFRQLLDDVTLTPAMGAFLNMLHNRKPDPAQGIRADENYAREVMQLFSIGLVQLNADGTPRRDAAGNPIPTFNQPQVEGLARVFTGWSFAPQLFLARDFYGPSNWTTPMQAYENYHDRDAKIILDDRQIAAGQDARTDLTQALDIIAAHPNVGPFFSRQLIQRLVTSNPSPAYVQRVAGVFADNGRGQRGDLGAVVRAILLDAEARAPAGDLAGYGKLREPVLRVTQLWRAFDGRSASGRYYYANAANELGQAPYRAPSVFNFFRPDYSPVGVLANAGLAAPEFQITNESSSILVSNALFDKAISHNRSAGAPPDNAVTISTAAFEAQASQPDQLLDDLNLLLVSGQLGLPTRSAIAQHVAAISGAQAPSRVSEAVYLIMSSPQYAVQR